MVDLSKDEVKTLGRAAGLDIQEPELTEVTHSLNALFAAIEGVNPPGLEKIEPLPIIIPQEGS